MRQVIYAFPVEQFFKYLNICDNRTHTLCGIATTMSAANTQANELLLRHGDNSISFAVGNLIL